MNANYIWVNNQGMFQDKTYIFDKDTYNLFPNWNIHNEIMLAPIINFKDPFNRDENHRLVYCDLYHIINGERYLDLTNKRDEFLTLIDRKEKCEIVQTFELYADNFTNNKLIYNPIKIEFIEFCSYIGIHIYCNETHYTLSCYNNVYETVWISRYIFHRLVLEHNLTLYFTELALINNDLEELFNNMDISNNNMNDIFQNMSI